MKSSKFLDCVMEDGFLSLKSVSCHLNYLHFVYDAKLCYTASHLWSCPGSSVLIVIEILTIVVSATRLNHKLDSLKCSDETMT